MDKRLKTVAFAAALAASALGPISLPRATMAANSKLADGIRQGEAQQSAIKVQVQRATEDLNGIIAELNRNGIGGEDVKILVKIRDVLGDLFRQGHGPPSSLFFRKPATPSTRASSRATSPRPWSIRTRSSSR